MSSSSLVTSFVVVGLLLASTLSYAESPAPQYALGIGLDVSSGSFGTSATTTYVGVPLIVDWFPTERLDLELTVPLFYRRTTGVDTANTAVAKSVTKGPGGSGGSGGSGGVIIGAGGTIISTGACGTSGGDFGVGDVTLTSGYAVLMDSDSSPLIRPTVYIKFPTADESKGFGTGEFDFGAGIAVSKWLGNWQPFTEGRYIFQGASYDETWALDFVIVDAGVAYSWNESLLTSAYARFGSKPFEGMSDPLEARLKTVWRFEKSTYAEAYVLKGLSDGSPDYGGGISVFREF